MSRPLFELPTAKDLEAQEKRQAARARRYDLQRVLHRISDSDTLKLCRKSVVSPNGQVSLRLTGTTPADRRAGFAGLSTCGSPWACPPCAAKIAASRCGDLVHVLSWAVHQEHTVAMITPTIRHHRGLPLAATWDAVVKAFGAVTAGRSWAGETEREHQQRVQKWEDRVARATPAKLAKLLAKPPAPRKQGGAERWGLLGWARAFETTYGENGWHPHLHIILVFEGQRTPERIQRFADEVFWPSWQRSVEKSGFETLKDSGGMDVRCSTAESAIGLAAYVAKQLALEATHGLAKKGRKGGRTPFQILDDARNGEAQDIALWLEWESTSKGRQQLTWSKDLRALAGLAEQEKSDAEIAEEELGGEELLLMPKETWRVVYPEADDLLATAERDGIEGAQAWLRARGLDWLLPLRLPQPDGPRHDPTVLGLVEHS